MGRPARAAGCTRLTTGSVYIPTEVPSSPLVAFTLDMTTFHNTRITPSHPILEGKVVFTFCASLHLLRKKRRQITSKTSRTTQLRLQTSWMQKVMRACLSRLLLPLTSRQRRPRPAAQPRMPCCRETCWRTLCRNIPGAHFIMSYAFFLPFPFGHFQVSVFVGALQSNSCPIVLRKKSLLRENGDLREVR